MNQPKRNKVFRLDATRLSEDDSLVSVCIPYWFRNLLLDTTERYLWSKVWQDGDNGHDLTSEEIDRIEYAIYRLTIECNVDNCCDQIQDILDRLEELENMNVTNNINCGGCGSGGSGGGSDVINIYVGNLPTACLPVTPTGDDPPPVVVTPGVPPAGWPDYNAYDEARCAIANHGWELAFQWVTALSRLREEATTVTSMLWFLISIVPGLIIGVLGLNTLLGILGLMGQLVALGEIFDDFFEDIRQWMIDQREDIICQAYNALEEIPLWEAVQTQLQTYMETIWEDREYSETVVSLLTQALRFTLPSSLLGLFLNNEDSEFFGGYVPPIPCDCGGSVPGSVWESDVEIGGLGSSITYGTNTLDDHDLEATLVGAGAGGSYQEGRDFLPDYLDVPEEELTMNVVTFTLQQVTFSATATPAGSMRQLLFGTPGQTTVIMSAEYGAGIPVAMDEGLITFGLRLESEPNTGQDFDIVVPSRGYLRPQFIFGGVGYLMSDTAVTLDIRDFTIA